MCPVKANPSRSQLFTQLICILGQSKYLLTMKVLLIQKCAMLSAEYQQLNLLINRHAICFVYWLEHTID